jgi:hypothetical protein
VQIILHFTEKIKKVQMIFQFIVRVVRVKYNSNQTPPQPSASIRSTENSCPKAVKSPYRITVNSSYRAQLRPHCAQN